jgi:hypothetical protein
MKLPVLAQILAAALLVAACTSSPGSSGSPAAALTAIPSVAETTSPSPAAATAPPTVTPRSSATSSGEADQPPPAALGTGDYAVTGQLGSYCWVSHCVDTAGFFKPRLPELTVQEGNLLVFSMEDGEFASWTAAYSADQEPPINLAQGGQPVDPDVSQPTAPPLTYAEFPSPPVGDWIVQVAVRFADGGDAAFGWHVIVE